MEFSGILKNKAFIQQTDLVKPVFSFLWGILFDAEFADFYDELQWDLLPAGPEELAQAGGYEEEIKAVTYHEAEVIQNHKGIWEMIVIFDLKYLSTIS